MRYWWVLLIIAIVLILPGLLFFSVGVAIWDDEPKEDDPATEEDESDDPQGTALMTIFLCVPTFWLPALVLIILSVYGFRDSRGLTHMAEVMKAHDSLHIDEAAHALEVSSSKAKKMMSRCINREMVHGVMKSEYYYSPRYLERAKSNLKRREYLIDMADILKAYRRVTISDFAKRIQMNEPDAERIILECLEDGLLFGYISRRSRVFFTREYLDQIEDVQIGWECRSCGSHNQEILLPGEVDRCPYCGSMSKAKGTRKKFVAFEVQN